MSHTNEDLRVGHETLSLSLMARTVSMLIVEGSLDKRNCVVSTCPFDWRCCGARFFTACYPSAPSQSWTAPLLILMTLSNPWFLFALVSILVLFHLDLLATFLNLNRLGRPVPKELEDVYPEADRDRLVDYISDSAKQSVLQTAFMTGVLILFWWGGGFAWVQQTSSRLATEWRLAPEGVGPHLIALSLMVVGQTLVSVPFQAWHTFGLEAKHGFNRTTVSTFVSDQIKGLAISAIIGLPLAAAVIWIFQHLEMAALYGWLLMAGFSILMAWLAPRVLMPLFLKFQPLPDGPLRESILALAERLHFPVSEVSIVDGSRRSTKANAFFAGFGKTRRIALYDTLLERYSTDEILAILAHEIGHNKRRHVPIHIAASLVELGLMFALLHLALRNQDFYAAFGVGGTPIGLGFVLFSVIYQPISTLTGLVTHALSRKHEFEADAFAKAAMGSADPLTTGLKKLSRDHLSHPSPHPLNIWLHYSHPPLAQRLAALTK